jgi:hypothetical protein
MCDNHHPVPTRRLEFKMVEDPALPGHMVRAHVRGRNSDYQIVTGRTDGLGCPACGSFEPTGEPRGIPHGC